MIFSFFYIIDLCHFLISFCDKPPYNSEREKHFCIYNNFLHVSTYSVK